MAGISSKAAGSLENKKKWNAGTELNTDFDINIYETNFRGLDPQLGRFWQIDPLAELVYNNSPYTFGSNNPILINDPTGLQDSVRKESSTHDKPKVLEEVVVTSTKKVARKNGWRPWMTALGWGAVGADSYMNLQYKGDWMYRSSKGEIQSIFDTKWGAKQTPEELGNLANYSKNARGAIRTTKFAKYLKIGGKVVIVLSTLADANDVLNAYLQDDPNATAVYGKAAVNTAMIGVGYIPVVGWVISGLYFAIDATIGWPAAIESSIWMEKNKKELRDLKIMNYSDWKY
jgi:RHS repeat-associated protein